MNAPLAIGRCRGTGRWPGLQDDTPRGVNRADLAIFGPIPLPNPPKKKQKPRPPRQENHPPPPPRPPPHPTQKKKKEKKPPDPATLKKKPPKKKTPGPADEESGGRPAHPRDVVIPGNTWYASHLASRCNRQKAAGARGPWEIQISRVRPVKLRTEASGRITRAIKRARRRSSD